MHRDVLHCNVLRPYLPHVPRLCIHVHKGKFLSTRTYKDVFFLQIVQEYQRAVVFRLGRLVPDVKGPGIFFIIPCIDTFLNIDLRVASYNVPSQEVCCATHLLTVI